MINILIQILFCGFALWSIILPLLLLFIKNTKTNFIKEIDHTAVRIIQFAGIAFMCHLLINILLYFNDLKYHRMFGKYWFGFWTFPFAYFFLTQLLWFRKIKNNVFLRIIISFVILFALYIEKFIILMTSLEVPNSSAIAIGTSVQTIIIDCLFKLIFFSAFVFSIHFIIDRLKKKKTNNS